MDRRDEVAQKCLLVKSAPPETDEETVKRSIDRLARVVRVCRYTEHADDSTRFIVQLRSREDASKLIHDDNVLLTTSQGNVKVSIGFCPECILSNDWVDSWSPDLSDEEILSSVEKTEWNEGDRQHDNFIPHISGESDDEADPDLYVNDLIKGSSKIGQTSRHDSVGHERTFKDHHDEVTALQSHDSDAVCLPDTDSIDDLIADDMAFTSKENNLETGRPQSLYVAGDSDEDDKYIPSFTIPVAPVRPVKHSENRQFKISETEPSICPLIGGDKNKSPVTTIQNEKSENYKFEIIETGISKHNLEGGEENKHRSPVTSSSSEEDEGKEEVNREPLPDLEKKMTNLEINKRHDGNMTDMHVQNAEPADNTVPCLRETPEASAAELQRIEYTADVGHHIENEITTISVKMPMSVEQTKVSVKSAEQKSFVPDTERKTLTSELDFQRSTSREDVSNDTSSLAKQIVSSKEETIQSLEPPFTSQPTQPEISAAIQKTENINDATSLFLAKQIESSEGETKHSSYPTVPSQSAQPGISDAFQPAENMPGNLYPVIQNGQVIMPMIRPNIQNNQHTNTQQGYSLQQANQRWPLYYIDRYGQPLLFHMLPQNPHGISPRIQHAGNLRMASPVEQPNQPGMGPQVQYPSPGRLGMSPHMQNNSGMNTHHSQTYQHIWPDYPHHRPSGVGVPSAHPPMDSMRGDISTTHPDQQLPVVPSAPPPTKSMINRGEILPLTMPQTQVEASAKDSAEQVDESPVVDKNKAEVREKPRKQSESEPMEWETSPTGGARQKNFKQAEGKGHSNKQENYNDTESDDSDLGDYHRSWANNDSNTELNYGFVKIVKGELSTMKVDVIVNSSNPDLDMMKGVVSRSLATAGGKKIQQYCKKKYPQGIKPGDIAITKGGNLSCKKIFHCIIPQWDGGTGAAVKDLEDIIGKCIQRAGEKNYKSIAFPAVGAGQLGFPVDKVATLLITGAQKYQKISVIKVVIVIFSTDKKALKAFERTAGSLLGPPFTTSVTDEDSNSYEKLQEVDRERRHYEKLKTDEKPKRRKVSKYKKSTDEEEEHLYDSIKPMKEEGPDYLSLKPLKTVQTPIIRVTWADELCKEDITLYFEHKKSGGGDIKEYNLLMDMKEGTIEFNDPQTVENILKKGTDHSINNKIVKVQKVTDSGMEERKVLVDGLNPNTSQDGLTLFLEAKAKIDIEGVLYSANKERAVVTFTKEPDLMKLKAETEKKQLDKHTLRISKVPLCRTVSVTGLKGSVSEDTIWFFFENENRTGGGEVDKVELDSEDNAAVVTFTDPKIARRVADSKQVMKLNGHPLKVSLFYPFLKSQQTVKLPDPIVLSGMDPHVIKFILNSKPNKDSLIKALQKINASLDNLSAEKITISCRLDEKMRNIIPMVRSWKGQVKEVVESFFAVMLKEEISVLDKAWTDVLRELNALNISHPDGVAVVLSPADHTVVIVGHNEYVLDLKQRIERIIKDAEHKLKQQSEQVTKKENMKMFQIQLLWRSKFQTDMKKAFPGLQIEIDIDGKQIILTGNFNDVSAGRIKIFEKLQSFVSEMEEMTVGRKDLFFKGSGRDIVVAEIKKKDLFVVWDVKPSSQTFCFYGNKKKEIQEGIKIFKSCLPEKKISMKDHFEKFIASSHWQKTLQNLKEKYEEKFCINSENNEICVTTVKGVFEEILNIVEKEVADFVNLHNIVTDFLHVKEGTFQFMKAHLQVGVTAIKSSLQTLHVKIKESETARKFGYQITGTKDGILIAKRKLSKLMSSIISDTHTIVSFGAFDFFTSVDGLDKIKVIETVNTCVISRKTEMRQNRMSSRSLSAPPVTKAVCRTGNGRKISVVMGDMTQLTIDVMVNAANDSLDHGAGLAGAIVEAGGNEIQLECDSYVKRYGNLKAGEAVKSGPGRLPCQMVVHAVGPTWRGGKQGEEKELRSAVKESLELAKYKKSIAVPALSAGIFGYPLHLSVETIVDEVKRFLSKRDIGKLEHVCFCDISNETVDLFVRELHSSYGKGSVRLVDDTLDDTSDDNDTNDNSDDSNSSYDNVDEDERRKPSVKIKLIKGEIAKTKADVIVNSTQSDLNLASGAISKSILQHGGRALQYECNKRHPNGIKPGMIAETSGGNLDCKQVYHGTFPQWDHGGGVCSNLLRNFVLLCLTTADKSGLASIAFPAIGSGQLRWPASEVAKIMFKSVMDFSIKHPQSSVARVDIVVFPLDTTTVQAFEEQEFRMKSGDVKGATGTVPRSGHRKHDAYPDRLGCLGVTVKQGDITLEKTKAIVNSTDSQMNLSRGALAKAILKAGGSQIQTECDKQKENMLKYGLAVTTGGHLSCSWIIHMKSQFDSDSWENSIVKCLQFAEKLKCESLALPALGTGQANCDPQKMADTIFKAIRQFTGPAKYLKEVRIVIFQSDMADTFKLVLAQHLKGREHGSRHGKRSGSHRYHSDQAGRDDSPDTVEFLIWSNSEYHLKKAMTELDTALEREIRKEYVSSLYLDVIKGLADYQIRNLHSIAASHNSKIELAQERGRIAIIGRSKYTSKAVLEITNQLREYEKHKDKVQQAKAIGKYVQWFYDDNGTMTKYNAQINLEIETAYKSKQPTVKIRDGDRKVYTLDFNKMESSNGQHKVKIQRKDLTSSSVSGGISLPKEWDQMGAGVSVKCVKLSTSDIEYIKVSQMFTTGTGIRNTGVQQQVYGAWYQQNAMVPGYYGGQAQGIIQIERIQNKYLYQQYQAKKQELQTKNQKNPEQLLWHGTSADTVQNIINNGFNRSYCGKNGTAYGNGVYFAVNASLSLGYCHGSGTSKHMFLVQVLTGETCRGQGGLRVLPNRTGNIPYDSACDNPGGPSMYVIFHDSQAYPKYHITFH